MTGGIAMIEGIPLVGLSSPALLGVAIMLLLLGKIIPRATLEDSKAESDRWREAYENERQARALSEAQTKELIELAKTTHAIIVAMFETTRRMDREGGGANATSLASEDK